MKHDSCLIVHFDNQHWKFLFVELQNRGCFNFHHRLQIFMTFFSRAWQLSLFFCFVLFLALLCALLYLRKGDSPKMMFLVLTWCCKSWVVEATFSTKAWSHAANSFISAFQPLFSKETNPLQLSGCFFRYANSIEGADSFVVTLIRLFQFSVFCLWPRK